MDSIGGYARKTTTSLEFDAAIEKVTELLKEVGFGVLTEIDVQATMKNKLDLDMKPFRILGACNPPYAHQALEANELISVLLPCNVVVTDDGDHRSVAMMDPNAIGTLTDDEEVKKFVAEIDEKLSGVLAKVEAL